MLRLAYSSDLHARIEHYRTLLECARSENAASVLRGGALLPASRDPSRLDLIQQAWVQDRLAPLLDVHRAAGGAPVAAIPGNHDTLGGIAALGAAGVHLVHETPLDRD